MICYGYTLKNEVQLSLCQLKSYDNPLNTVYRNTKRMFCAYIFEISVNQCEWIEKKSSFLIFQAQVNIFYSKMAYIIVKN